MQVATEGLTMKPISPSISVIRLQLAVLQFVGSDVIPFVMGMIVPEIILNLIASNSQKFSEYNQNKY